MGEGEWWGTEVLHQLLVCEIDAQQGGGDSLIHMQSARGMGQRCIR